MSLFVSIIVIVLFFLNVLNVNAATDTEYELYGIISNLNDISEHDIKLIASNLNAAQVTFNSSTCKTIHSYNSDFKVVDYHNTAPTDDIINIENDKESALRYPFSILTSSLRSDKSDNIINLQLIDTKAFTSIPIKSSTTTNNYSINCHQFVSWIRINNEYIKVEDIKAVNSNNYTYKLTVNRGFIGNGKSIPNISSHNINEMIFAPVYSGSAPGQSSCNKLQYDVNPESKYAVDSLANHTYNDLQQNADGSWYDCFTSQPAESVDGLGNHLSIKQVWDNSNNQYFNCKNYKTAQQNRLTNIFKNLQTVHNIQAKDVTIYGNDMFYGAYFNCDTFELLQPNPPSFPYPLDGYCIEGYALKETGDCSESYIAWHDVDNWKNNVNELINATSLNLHAMPMIAQAGCKSPAIEKLSDVVYQQVLLFGYCSYLMGVKSKTDGTMFGIPPMVQRNNARYVYIDDIFYYKIGNPDQFENVINNYQIHQHISYWRTFKNGLVVINPNNMTDSNIKLPKQYIDPTTNKTVNEITLNAHSAIILLNQ